MHSKFRKSVTVDSCHNTLLAGVSRAYQRPSSTGALTTRPSWGSPIMPFFSCDYAIFYATFMLLLCHDYAKNYADYAKLCSIMLNYARLC